MQSGLCKTNTIPRPQPSLFYFPGATKHSYCIHYDLMSLLHIVICRIDIEADFR